MIAIFVGSSALKALNAQPARYTGGGMAKTVDAHRDRLEKQRASRSRAEAIAGDQATLQSLVASTSS
jgi:hypothetical protein